MFFKKSNEYSEKSNGTTRVIKETKHNPVEILQCLAYIIGTILIGGVLIFFQFGVLPFIVLGLVSCGIGASMLISHVAHKTEERTIRLVELGSSIAISSVDVGAKSSDNHLKVLGQAYHAARTTERKQIEAELKEERAKLPTLLTNTKSDALLLSDGENKLDLSNGISFDGFINDESAYADLDDDEYKN